MICKMCGVAIPPKTFTNHIRKLHAIDKYTISELSRFRDAWDLIPVSNIGQIKECIPAIRHIKVHPGFVCSKDDCRYAVVSEKTMRLHCSKIHGSFEYRFASLQTIFAVNTCPYFEVFEPETSQAPTIPLGFESDLQAAMEEFDEARRMEHQRELDAADELSECGTEPWLSFTGLPKYLAGLNLPDVAKMVSCPNFKYSPSSSMEQLINRSADGFFERLSLAIEGVSPNVLDSIVAENLHETSRMPFKMVGPETWKKYCRSWKQFFLYLHRLYNVPDFVHEATRGKLKTLLENCLLSDNNLKPAIDQWLACDRSMACLLGNCGADR